MRRLCTLVLFLAGLTAVGFAQIPTRGNVFFGYAYNHLGDSGDGINTNGWDAQLEGNFLPWIGIVADIGATYGSDVTERNFLFGPRVSVRVSRIRPFAELLVGAARINVADSVKDTAFASAVGGGLDYQVFGPVSIRGQMDWIKTRFFSDSQNDVRFVTGLTLHF